MAKATTKAASTDAPKRKMLTPAERVAKLEADLAAARAKADEKAGKQSKVLTEKREKLVAKIEDLQSQIREIDVELEQLGDGTVPDPDPIVSDQEAAAAEGSDA